ncbi:hypothetical protein T472_0216130 [Youngiibacter fragilis 232.1]|uniref:Uncharacterized protein n=1 Tax=Youngiibacter fragilis 232.1 TaxID=994573 RepID=V7I359_9CLOT|nr:hypothetical protein T472_0216130 [Youngiibacter fragilis 232.1]
MKGFELGLFFGVIKFRLKWFEKAMIPWIRKLERVM